MTPLDVPLRGGRTVQDVRDLLNQDALRKAVVGQSDGTTVRVLFPNRATCAHGKLVLSVMFAGASTS
jgi:hypothetical protein